MTRAPRFLLLLVLAAGGAARGDSPPPPIDITSDAFDSDSTPKETTSYFTGHVVVTGDNLKITCDKLTVISLPQQGGKVGDPTKDPQKLKYLLAVGHVHILQGLREATAGRADVYPLLDKMVLTQSPVVTDRANNSVFTGDKLVLLHGEGKVTGTHVHISAPGVKNMGFDKNLPTSPPPSP